MKRLLLLFSLLAIVWGGDTWAQSGLVTFKTDSLVIETADGARHTFKVEVADTAEQRAQGLMFRQHLAADAGMLFIFDGIDVRAMWMKNTLIPLDMLFIDEKGKIVRIEQRTVPHSERAIVSGGPVAAVLEVNAGTASRLGIKPGDRVRHPAFN